MRLGKKPLVLVLGLVLVLALTYQLWPWSAADARQRMLSGNIEAHESVLSFKTVQSRIAELPFNEGQWVKQGAVVARVDDADLRQQTVIAAAALAQQSRQLEAARQSFLAAQKSVDADQAELAQRRLDLKRSSDLGRRGFVSGAVVDQAATAVTQAAAVAERDKALAAAAERNIAVAQAAVHSAEEAAQLAQIVLGYSVLSAPFAGVVTVRQAELGEVVVPGTPVITLADLDHVWLRAYLNEQDLSRVRLGQQVKVSTDARPGKAYQGRVSFIADKAEFTPKNVETHSERVTQVYRVKIDIDNPTHELLPGMPADVLIELQ